MWHNPIEESTKSVLNFNLQNVILFPFFSEIMELDSRSTNGLSIVTTPPTTRSQMKEKKIIESGSSESPKPNSEGKIVKKRGRPKGSKNKWKRNYFFLICTKTFLVK